MIIIDSNKGLGISINDKFCLLIDKYYKEIQEMAKRCSQPSSASSSSATATGVPSMMTMSPRQHFTGHPSRLLNSQAEKLEETVSRTARIPPPKLLPSAVRRADSFTTTAQLPTQVGITIPLWYHT